MSPQRRNGMFAGKAWLLEVGLDVLATLILHSSLGLTLVLHGMFQIEEQNRAAYFLREADGFLVFPLVLAIGAFLMRIWNYFIIMSYARMRLVKKNGFFEMRLAQFAIFWCWIACFVLGSLVIALMNNQDFLEGLTDPALLFGYALIVCPILVASLLAPILTYRLTGYCFDSDFSLPPWSHGRWGFGKPAAVAEPAAAETPVRADDGGPDARPPNSGGRA